MDSELQKSLKRTGGLEALMKELEENAVMICAACKSNEEGFKLLTAELLPMSGTPGDDRVLRDRAQLLDQRMVDFKEQSQS